MRVNVHCYHRSDALSRSDRPASKQPVEQRSFPRMTTGIRRSLPVPIVRRPPGSEGGLTA